MATWRIYYGDGSLVVGETAEDWLNAPSDGVQAIALMEPPAVEKWTYKKAGLNHLVRDRQLWTGVDSYDPFGWGSKEGSLIEDALYWQIWERACGDD